MKKLITPISFLMTVSSPVLASVINCPESILVAEKINSTPESVWKDMIVEPDRPHHFYAVYFSAGSPMDNEILAEDDGVDTKKKKVDIYHFHQPETQPLWVSCVYLDTSVILSRPVTEPHQQCTVTYNPATNFASVKEVECH